MEAAYRISRYNLFLRKKDIVTGVNLYNRNLFNIDLEKYQLLMSFAEDLESLKKSHSDLFNAMYKLGIIEDADMDIPNILLMKNRQEVFLSTRRVDITINLTLDCNFSCWYCFESHSKGKMKKEVQSSILKYIESLIKDHNIKDIRVNWFGGEPLIVYNSVFEPLAYKIKEICTFNNVNLVNTITTNGVLIKDETIAFLKDIDVRTLQITLDGDREQHNKVRYNKAQSDSFSTIVKNICRIVTEIPSAMIILRINYRKESLDDCIGIINHFPSNLRNRIRICLVNIFQEKDYSVDSLKKENHILQIFSNMGFRVFQQNSITNRHYSCYAELNNQMIINYDGRIFKCVHCDFMQTSEDGVLTADGNVIWNENNLAKRLARATFDNPSCLKCKLLPVCTGGCSKYAFEDDRSKKSYKCPVKPPIIYVITDLMNKFSKTGYKVADIKQFEQLMFDQGIY